MIRVGGRCLFAVLTTCVLFTSVAYADSFRLRVENYLSGIGVVITDNDVGDANPLAGAITYLGSLNSLAVNITTGISQPLIGSVNNYAALHLNSVNIQVSGAGALRLTLEDSYTIRPRWGHVCDRSRRRHIGRQDWLHGHLSELGEFRQPCSRSGTRCFLPQWAIPGFYRCHTGRQCGAVVG